MSLALTLPFPALFSMPARVVHHPDAPTDEDLVRRAQGGDRWAEEALYRRHVHYVAGAVTRLLARRADAEDVVQEAFAIAYETLDTLRDGGAVRSWIAQIAVRLVHRRFRRRRLTRALGLDRGADDATLAQLAAPDAGPEVHAELAELDRAVAKLPPELRVPWMLRRVEGWEIEEVADACGCSPATVKRRVADADERVQRRLRPREVAP